MATREDLRSLYAAAAVVWSMGVVRRPARGKVLFYSRYDARPDSRALVVVRERVLRHWF